MVPGPADMTNPDFWNGKTPETLRTVILHGVSGSAMPGYEGTLKPDELDALVAYIEGFRPAAPARTR
jgi:mono/diheme cytochrome c family protein